MLQLNRINVCSNIDRKKCVQIVEDFAWTWFHSTKISIIIIMEPPLPVVGPSLKMRIDSKYFHFLPSDHNLTFAVMRAVIWFSIDFMMGSALVTSLITERGGHGAHGIAFIATDWKDGGETTSKIKRDRNISSPSDGHKSL